MRKVYFNFMKNFEHVHVTDFEKRNIENSQFNIVKFEEHFLLVLLFLLGLAALTPRRCEKTDAKIWTIKLFVLVFKSLALSFKFNLRCFCRSYYLLHQMAPARFSNKVGIDFKENYILRYIQKILSSGFHLSLLKKTFVFINKKLTELYLCASLTDLQNLGKANGRGKNRNITFL
ncbi:UNVERIFIED_CONTAM: hypothetical protein NCL1_13977 [Trichonephila clavipes]